MKTPSRLRNTLFASGIICSLIGCCGTSSDLPLCEPQAAPWFYCDNLPDMSVAKCTLYGVSGATGPKIFGCMTTESVTCVEACQKP